MELQEAIRNILEADQETIDHLPPGLAKREAVRIREIAVEVEDEPDPKPDPAPREEEPQPSLGYANDLYAASPDEHRSRSDPFVNNETTANWLLGTIQTALERTNLTTDQLNAIVSEAVRQHKKRRRKMP